MDFIDKQNETVSDPLGREVLAAVLVVERDGRRTVYVEASQASGLHLLGADERDPSITGTWGSGSCWRRPWRPGLTRSSSGVGGSGTHDAGAGDAPQRSARTGGSELARGGRHLATVSDDVLLGLPGVIDRWRGSTSSWRPTTTRRCSASRAPAPSTLRARGRARNRRRPSRRPWAASTGSVRRALPTPRSTS